MRLSLPALLASSLLATGLALAPTSTAEAGISDCTALTWFASWSEFKADVCEVTWGDCIEEQEMAHWAEMQRFFACEMGGPLRDAPRPGGG